MSKETQNAMSFKDKVLGIVSNLQESHYKKKSDERVKSFLKEARALTEIESESFVQSLTDEGLKTSYLNDEGVRLACVSNGDKKSYSMAKDLALGEDVFATWTYDQNNQVKELEVLDEGGFDFAVKTMKPAVEVMEKERLDKASLKENQASDNRKTNRPS